MHGVSAALAGSSEEQSPSRPPIAIGAAGASALRCDVMRPSELGDAEIALWHELQAADAGLQRAFLAPGFALACEHAHGNAYVGVLHTGGRILGFLPFQFRDRWHRRVALAERIGGNLSDAAGLVGPLALVLDPAHMLRLCGIAVLYVTHLMAGQDRFGLTAEWTQTSYIADIGAGGSGFLRDLLERNRRLVRDTERCLRKAAATIGPLRLETQDRIPSGLLDAVINEKREQYSRTQVADPFLRGSSMRLISALNEAPGPSCRLLLSRLLAGDRVLAQHLGLQCQGVLSYWFPVYDHTARDLSPGRLLLWRLIEAADERGIQTIDYGEGDAQYKRELSTGTMRLGIANWTSGRGGSLPARLWQSASWRIARHRSAASQRGAHEQ